MSEEEEQDNMHQSVGARSREIPRREFIKLAALAGLLAGCGPVRQAVVPPADTSFPTSTPVPMTPPTARPATATAVPPTPSPTATPAPPTAVPPTATATPVPPTATATIVARRPEVLKLYPDVPSKVVRTHHAGVWNGDQLAPAAMREMLDASITNLTGMQDAREAWAALFDPGERIGIKVNVFRNSLIWTHLPLVLAVTGCLQEAGIPAEQIVLFDYFTSEFETAAYPINLDGPGVRCYGTDGDYAPGWQVSGATLGLSNILLSCNALINMPVLKSHMIAGLSFALKNHYGSISRPESLHYGQNMNVGMAALNALPPIKDRTRLIIGDALEACLRYTGSFPYWRADWKGDSIFMSFDPVAQDTVGLEVYRQLLTEAGDNPAMAISKATPWLQSGAELGLGTNDPKNMELVEVKLG